MLVKLPTIVNHLLQTTRCLRTDYRRFVSGCTVLCYSFMLAEACLRDVSQAWTSSEILNIMLQ